jgi:hypothetical protein
MCLACLHFGPYILARSLKKISSARFARPPAGDGASPSRCPLQPPSSPAAAGVCRRAKSVRCRRRRPSFSRRVEGAAGAPDGGGAPRRRPQLGRGLRRRGEAGGVDDEVAGSGGGGPARRNGEREPLAACACRPRSGPFGPDLGSGGPRPGHASGISAGGRDPPLLCSGRDTGFGPGGSRPGDRVTASQSRDGCREV